MSDIAISIQTLGNKNDTYLRKVVGSLRKDEVLKAVSEMLDDHPAHTLGKPSKSSWRGHKKKLAAVRGDEDTIPGVEVDATVEKAFAE